LYEIFEVLINSKNYLKLKINKMFFLSDAAYATIPECSTDTAKNKTSYDEVELTSIPIIKLQEYIKDDKFIRKQFQVIKGGIRLK